MSESPAPASNATDVAPGRWRAIAHRSMAGSLLTGALSQLVLIPTGILVARSLGPEDRGYLALLALVPAILSQAGSLGIPLATTYYVARDRIHAREIANSLIAPALIQTLVTILAQVVILSLLLRGEPDPVQVAAIITLPLLPGLFAQHYGLAILQGQQHFAAFNVLRVMPAALYALGVAAAFVVNWNGLIAITTIWVVTSIGGAAVTLAIAVRRLPGDVRATFTPPRWEMTKFGLKGLFGSASPIESFRLDQAVIGLFLSPVALGVYVVAQSFTNLPRFFAQSIGMVAYPQVASHSSGQRRVMWQYFLLGVLISAAVVAALEATVGWLVPFFFGQEFASASSIAQILLIGTLFVAARRVLADAASGAGYPGLSTIAEAASWVSLVPGLILLVPPLEARGVALALTISWALSLFVLIAALGLTGQERGVTSVRARETS